MKKERVGKPYDSRSLEEIIESLSLFDEKEEPAEKLRGKSEMRMGMNDILKDREAFNQEKKMEKMVMEKRRIEPSFDDGRILHFPEKTEYQTGSHAFNVAQKEQNQQRKRRQQVQFNVESYPVLTTNSKAKQASGAQFSKSSSYKFGKGPRIVQQQPQYLVTFSQEIVFKGVKVALEFGDYRNYERQINEKTALIIPFDDFSNNLNIFLDIQKRSNSNFQANLLDYLQKKKESTFRTGEIVNCPKLKGLPYEKFYFVKTVTREGSIEYASGKLAEFFKSLLPKASKEDIGTILITEFIWGKLETVTISGLIFKAILEGIRQLGGEKGLRKVMMILGKKADYRIYSENFRKLSDSYLDTFYE